MSLVTLENVTIDIPILDARRSFRTALLSRYTGGQISTADKKVSVRALSDISFSLAEGDRLGIVGHNGSGKTTLLRVLAGVYEPTFGHVERRGRVTALFNPSLGMEMDETGLQNIANIGLHLGMTPLEVASVTDEVVDFCELGDFINLPVRTYSSGMLVRLGFAMATALDPEILVLDEGIGAGDARFADRARQRLETFYAKLRTVAIASHSDAFIRQMCNKALLLEHGRIVCIGPVEEVLELYAQRIA